MLSRLEKGIGQTSTYHLSGKRYSILSNGSRDWECWIYAVGRLRLPIALALIVTMIGGNDTKWFVGGQDNNRVIGRYCGDGCDHFRLMARCGADHAVGFVLKVQQEIVISLSADGDLVGCGEIIMPFPLQMFS